MISFIFRAVPQYWYEDQGESTLTGGDDTYDHLLMIRPHHDHLLKIRPQPHHDHLLMIRPQPHHDHLLMIRLMITIYAWYGLNLIMTIYSWYGLMITIFMTIYSWYSLSLIMAIYSWYGLSLIMTIQSSHSWSSSWYSPSILIMAPLHDPHHDHPIIICTAARSSSWLSNHFDSCMIPMKYSHDTAAWPSSWQSSYDTTKWSWYVDPKLWS